MPKYLIDFNLPYFFSLWNSSDYIRQIDLDPKAKDKDIKAQVSRLENNTTNIALDAILKVLNALDAKVNFKVELLNKQMKVA